MLESITVQRFKSIREIELSFGCVNLFIGGNGTGKSNILEAIGVLSAAMYRGVADEELSRKGVRLTPPSLMKSAFKSQKLPKTFRLEANLTHTVEYALELSSGEKNTHLSFFSERCVLDGKPVFGRSARGVKILGVTSDRRWFPTRSLWDQSRSAFDFPHRVQEQFDDLSRFAIYSPQTEFLREVKSGIAIDPPVGLHGEGLSAAVASLIFEATGEAEAAIVGERDKANHRQVMDALGLVWLPRWASMVRVGAVDPLLKSREMTSSNGNIVHFIDRYMHEKRNTLSAYDSSEGTLFLLFMSVLIAHIESPPIFALDNVDSALNPALTRRLLETAIKLTINRANDTADRGPRQIFLTSHNPTSLDAFDLFDDRQRVFVVSRNANGHTVADRLKPQAGASREDWMAQFAGKKLSQLWIDGDIRNALGQV